MRHRIDLTEEPVGQLWHALLDALASHADHLQLVLRDGAALAVGSLGGELLARMQPFLIEQIRRSSWPGTVLRDHAATILHYSMQALPMVRDAADRLYAWQQPDLPEDLALLRADGSPLLASITHEHDAWLDLDDVELLSIRGLLSPR